jgi:hypothetical protein
MTGDARCGSENNCSLSTGEVALARNGEQRSTGIAVLLCIHRGGSFTGEPASPRPMWTRKKLTTPAR